MQAQGQQQAKLPSQEKKLIPPPVLSTGEELVDYPVRLLTNHAVELRPGEEMELRGPIRGNIYKSNLISILPCEGSHLPPGVLTKNTAIIAGLEGEPPLVQLLVHNTSNSIATIRSKDVLARLYCQPTDDVSYKDQPVMDGLVGPACETEALVNGVSCRALLDSGSQVTTLSRSFYRDHLSETVPLEEISQAGFSVEGAGGQLIQFDGFLRIKTSFPKDVVGTDCEVETFALVCADTNYTSKTPMIVGTNTFRSLGLRCKEGNGPHFLRNIPVRSEVAYAYQDTFHDGDGKVGRIRLYDKRPVTIHAGSIKEFKGICRDNIPTTRDALLIQASPHHQLPEGIEVVNCLVPTYEQLPKVKVLVHNKSDKDIKVHPKKIVAELFTIQHETPICEAQQSIQSFFQGVQSSAKVDIHSDGGDGTNAGPESPLDQNIEFDFGDSPLSEEWKKRISDRLNTYKDVFSQHEFDVGHTQAVEHEIKLTDGPVVKERPRPIPARDFEDARQYIQSMLDAQLIKPSNSPYASPIVLVRKKSGKLRLCVDYRKINMRTIKDAYPIPKIADIYAALHGAEWFTTMDLKMGFHQIPMAEASKDYTAFVCPFGLYNFEVMSQGLSNSPLTFQRLMEKCVGDMNLKELLVYLDDIIIHGRTLEEAEERLVKTLERLRAFGLKLDPKKCKFFQQSVKHLGHIVSKDGVHPDPEKTSALTTWPRPTTLKELKSFLGFTGYFRQYVEDYSTIMRPLNDLTAGYIPPKTLKKLRAKGKTPTKVLTMNSSINSLWTTDCQQAFETIIQKLTSPPVLGFADLSSPFILHTDASNTGLGACLYQQQGNAMRVIAYASRGLSKSEVNYPAHKKEFLALKWAVTDKFHDYLYGGKFTAVTDNNPLTYVLSSAKLDAVGYRWLAALSVYDFDVKYRRGLMHLDADGMSRRPQQSPEADSEYDKTMEDIVWLAKRIRPDELSNTQEHTSLTSSTVNTIIANHGIDTNKASRHTAMINMTCVQKKNITTKLNATNDIEAPMWLEAMSMSEQAVPDSLEQPDIPVGQTSTPSITKSQWCELQDKDPDIKALKIQLKGGKTLSKQELSKSSPELKIYVREIDKMVMKDEVVYRLITDGKGMDWQQLVIPKSHRDWALRGIHDDVAHFGCETTLRLARQRFFWPYMSAAVENKVKNCERCIRRKAVPQKAPMSSIQVHTPLALVCMDFLSIEPDSKGTKDILVITDHFTKYAIAVPTKNQTAKVVAEALWDNLVSVYGWPTQLHSDQGRDFESKVISELCKLGNITKSRTTPYHPQGNPVERYNRTLLGMLGTLHKSQKVDWRKYVKPLTHAYNCTVNDTTGFSPYFLMFGRHARLPIDLVFGTDPDARKDKSPSAYVHDLRERLKHAYKLAQENTKKSAAKNQRYYDKKAHALSLETGDRVLVRNVNIRGKHKLADRWEDGVYIVKKCMPDTPVYVVTDEKGIKPDRTLHRNLLLPCGSLPLEIDEAPVQPPTRRKTRSMKTSNNNEDDDDDAEEYDEVELEFGAMPPIEVACVRKGPPASTLRPHATEFQPGHRKSDKDNDKQADVTSKDDQLPARQDPSDNDTSGVSLVTDLNQEHAKSTPDREHSSVIDNTPQETISSIDEVVEDVSRHDSPTVQSKNEDVHDENNHSEIVDISSSPCHDQQPSGVQIETSLEEQVKVDTDITDPLVDRASSSKESVNKIPNEEANEDTPASMVDSRRSSRNRHPPNRMTFDVLGEPTVQRYDMHTVQQTDCMRWALSSIFQREIETGCMLLTSTEREAMLKALYSNKQ